ncbi:MAG: aminoacyl-tRNA hydrolase [Candidatus Peregrinibacteria bacterium]
MNAMKLIVGLGNPGKEYANTRHNAGFMAADFLHEHFGFEPFKFSEKRKAEIASGEIASEKVVLAKPQTFMNLSGHAVQSLAGFYKIASSDVVVIYDDVDLPMGTLRVRPSGSSGGHKGVQSIIDQFDPDFIRFRIGIQPPVPFPGTLEDYVLGRLTSEEKKSLKNLIQDLPSAIEILFKEGVDAVQQKFN